jgi:hypothetical protein
MNLIILAQVLTGLSAGVVGSPAPVPAPEGVLRFMAEVPACESQKIPQCLRPGRWDRIGSAREIAAAISKVARDRDEADRMALFSAWEGGMRKTAVGDNGKSKGIVQLQGVSDAVAFDPVLALRAWQAKADAVACSANPPDERLAALASGSCRLGRALVKRREEVRRTIRAKLDRQDAERAVEERGDLDAAASRTFVGVE